MEHLSWEAVAGICICVDFAWNHAHHLKAGFHAAMAWVLVALSSPNAAVAEEAAEEVARD